MEIIPLFKEKKNAYRLETTDKQADSKGTGNHGLCETYNPGNAICKRSFY